MGFFDSFTSGFSNFGSIIGSGISSAFGFGSDLIGGIVGSPLGQQTLGQLGQAGVSALFDVIGLEPTGSSGTPLILGRPASQLPPGVCVSPNGQLIPCPLPSLQQPRPTTQPGSFGENGLFFNPSPVRNPFPAARPFLTAPPPSVPASQPFGVQPGTLVGGAVPAFPDTRFASFPPSNFATALGAGLGSGGGFQNASLVGLGGQLLRQLPGAIGGLALGAGIDAAVNQGGAMTPMFRQGMAGARAQFFRTTNPISGQDTWFRPAGRPLLWSGDLTACKRVNKIARRAKRKR